MALKTVRINQLPAVAAVTELPGGLFEVDIVGPVAGAYASKKVTAEQLVAFLGLDLGFTPLTKDELNADKQELADLALRPLLLALANMARTTTIVQTTAAPAQPAAPTDGVVDDKLNSFQGTAVTGFPTLLEYEFFGIPGTTGWVPASTDNGHQVGTHLYIDGLTGNIDKGGVGMRVAASGNRPAGKVLLSAEPFTGAAVTTTPTTPTTPTVNITPDPPTVNFDTTTRILSASASDYGTNELEYRHNSGTVLAYAAIGVDDTAHDASEWQYRVKAATGRNISNWAGNAAITAKNAAIIEPSNNSYTEAGYVVAGYFNS